MRIAALISSAVVGFLVSYWIASFDNAKGLSIAAGSGFRWSIGTYNGTVGALRAQFVSEAPAGQIDISLVGNRTLISQLVELKPKGKLRVPCYLVSMWIIVLLFSIPIAIRIAIVFRRFERLRRNQCTNCGYLLSGLPIDRDCPECGRQNNRSTVPIIRALAEPIIVLIVTTFIVSVMI